MKYFYGKLAENKIAKNPELPAKSKIIKVNIGRIGGWLTKTQKKQE